MVELEREIRARIQYLSFVFALLSFLAILQYYFQLSRIESLVTLAVLAIGVSFIVIWSGFSLLSREINRGFVEIGGLLRKQRSLSDNNPEEKKEEEVKTTGAGAFGGMVIGGLLGLILGPAGVIVGGMIGAAIGDQMEREKVKEEIRGRKERRK
ncbi:MAG: hypothetical protein AOA65_0059 [Candidatus Bathyarchaeota archaeon BA1]|nr:MAG: hypothetical protein AOA65_0059 [Candidatus Bathyarchaeota archaeon BA1]